MLHALLHGKLNQARPEPQRIEDALTSTVFGALIWAEKWDLLARWLAEQHSPQDASDCECWFWPRLGSVEPDVIIRVGGTLIVIEAKYRSDRHDLREASHEEDVRPSDQLVRQFVGITDPIEKRMRYVDTLENAIAHCLLVQVYVVDAKRLLRARRECDESRAKLPPGCHLEIATWQRLYRMLSAPEHCAQRWAVDLRAYLALAGLDSFQGVRRGLAPATAIQPGLAWRAPVATGFRTAMAQGARAGVASLLLWRHDSRRGARTTRGFEGRQTLVTASFARAIATWCRGWEGGVDE